jgi:hypothetical protein
MGQRQGKTRHFIARDKAELPHGSEASPFTVEIPDTEEVRANGIPEEAFCGCTGLTSVVVPDRITEIRKRAFNGCSGLTSIMLPDGVNRIEEGTFYGCSGLTSIVLPGGVTHLGPGAFNRCSCLTSIVLPDGVTRIEEGAFYGCSGLTSIVLPGGVTHLGPGAFNRCSSLTSIVLPGGVTHIGEFAFNGCSGLASIVLPESVTTVGSFAFNGCASLTSVILPKGVSRLEMHMFGGCTGLVVARLLCRDPIHLSCDAFADCNRMALLVAPRASGVVGTTFNSWPFLEGTGIVEDTAANQQRALDLQYWRVCTHPLCSAPHRRWVQTVLLVANRLRGGTLALPDEMWYMILESIRRWELGRAP